MFQFTLFQILILILLITYLGYILGCIHSYMELKKDIDEKEIRIDALQKLLKTASDMMDTYTKENETPTMDEE